MRDVTQAALAYSARARAMVERGEKPPHRAIQLVHGETGSEAMANSARAVLEGYVSPIEIFCKKPA